MNTPLKVLMLEDSQTDAEIIRRLLLKENLRHYQFELVDTRDKYLQQLEHFQPDLILADNALPQFDAVEALRILDSLQLHIPFILVTGTVSEEFAANIIKQGADDFVLKDRLARLPSAIDAALRSRQLEKEKQEAAEKQRLSDENYRTMMERVSDGFIALDNNWCYTYINKEAAEILRRQPEELLGKNVWKEFPESIDQAFHRACRKAMLTQSYENAVDFLPHYDRWLENHIYPSPDGLSVFFRDITDRKNAEKTIKASEIKYRTLVDQAFDGIIIYSPDGIIQECNHSASVNTGYTEEELLGMSVADLFTKEDLRQHPIVLDALKAGKVTRDHRRLKRKDGSYREMEIVTKMTPEGNMLAVGRDITERIEAEQKIRLSNERYEAVAKATSDGIWDYDYSTSKTYIAGTGYKYLFGYDIVNDYAEEGFWESRLHPDDKERVLAELEKSLADETVSQSGAEYRFRKADGTYAYLNDRYFIIRENGKPIRMLGAKQDITIRKEAEAALQKNFLEKEMLADRLSTILNTLPANIALLDNKGTIIDTNKEWQDFENNKGFIGHSTFIGENYIRAIQHDEAYDTDDGKKIASGIKAVLKNTKKEFIREYKCHCSLDHCNNWYRVVITPLRERENGGAVVMHMDISELKRLEQERLQSKVEEQKKITLAMLQGQEKERNAIGIELHDNVNQILVGTNVLLSVVKEFPKKAATLVPNCIENIKSAIAENRKLAHELVSPDMRSEPLMDQLKRLASGMLMPAGIKTEISGADFLEELLNDSQKLTLYRVAQEQCSNVVKYSKAKKVVLKLSTMDKKLVMRITDDGIGMDMNKTTKGIGLKNITSRLSVLSGKMHIESEPGKGFTMEIEIPLPVEAVLQGA